MKYDVVSERRSKYTLKITGPADAYSALARYAKRKVETFFVLTLDGAHQVIAVRIISIGLVNRTLVHPREIFFKAIKDNAVSIILAHNHPSSNLEPSSEDLQVTTRLKEAGDLLGIPVLDHIIFSPHGHHSLMM